MRNLTKAAKPRVLRMNEERWTQEYLDAVKNGTTPPRRWSHSDIRISLKDETVERCAYCDSNLGVTSPGDIEHILPRAHKPELVVVWENLTLVCSICNRTKSDYYDENLPLLNPYEDNPDEHLAFVDSLVYAKPHSDRGEMTIHQLGLARFQLTENRTRRITHVYQLLHNYYRAPRALKRSILDEIRQDVEKGEYIATVLAFLQSIEFDLAAELAGVSTAQ